MPLSNEPKQNSLRDCNEETLRLQILATFVESPSIGDAIRLRPFNSQLIMSYQAYRPTSPTRATYMAPISEAMGNLSIDDADLHYLQSEYNHAGNRQRRNTADRSADASPRRYYERKQTGRTRDPVVEVPRHSSKKHDDSGQKSASKTGYATRPKGRTSSDSGRRPLNLLAAASPSRQSPPHSGHDKSRAPQDYYYYADDNSGRYVIPASSKRSKYRTSYSGGERDGRSKKGSKDKNDSSKNSGSSGTRGPKKNSPVLATNNPSEADIYDGYSYTNPREQFYRDSDLIDDYRREKGKRKERPRSLAGGDLYSPQPKYDPWKAGPPRPTGGVDHPSQEDYRMGHDRNTNGRHRDADAGGRWPSQRNPVALHQQGDSVPSGHGNSDVYDSSGYRIRHDEDGTVVVVEDKPYHNNRRDLEQYPNRSFNDRRESASVSPDDGYNNRRYPKSDRDAYGRDAPTSSGAEGRRHLDRTYEYPREIRRHASDTEQESSEEDDDNYRHRRKDRRPADSRDWSPNRRRERYSDDSQDDRPHFQTNKEGKKEPVVTNSTISPESTENRQKKVQVVESNSTRETELAAPKGILKQPTDRFPEDPNAVREGVAPAKDAHIKGIPPAARWTKIDRRLVSPSALEGQERFEERPDYVIVLRVLSKDEIHGYALRTAEIRCEFLPSTLYMFYVIADTCYHQLTAHPTVKITCEMVMIMMIMVMMMMMTAATTTTTGTDKPTIVATSMNGVGNIINKTVPTTGIGDAMMTVIRTKRAVKITKWTGTMMTTIATEEVMTTVTLMTAEKG